MSQDTPKPYIEVKAKRADNGPIGPDSGPVVAIKVLFHNIGRDEYVALSEYRTQQIPHSTPSGASGDGVNYLYAVTTNSAKDAKKMVKAAALQLKLSAEQALAAIDDITITPQVTFSIPPRSEGLEPEIAMTLSGLSPELFVSASHPSVPYQITSNDPDKGEIVFYCDSADDAKRTLAALFERNILPENTRQTTMLALGRTAEELVTARGAVAV